MQKRDKIKVIASVLMDNYNLERLKKEECCITEIRGQKIASKKNSNNFCNCSKNIETPANLSFITFFPIKRNGLGYFEKNSEILDALQIIFNSLSGFLIVKVIFMTNAVPSINISISSYVNLNIRVLKQNL